MNITITKKEQKDTEDIFRVGNLVEYKGSIILVTDKGGMPSNVIENKDYFCGILMSIYGFDGVRYAYIKEGFKQFHGKVELSIE